MKHIDYRDERRQLVRDANAALIKTPKPDCDAELAILSHWYFGAALRLSKLCIYGEGASYEVEQKYSDYHGEGAKFTSYCCDGYDHSANFWRHVIGDLTCGGIATHSYGQVRINGHRDKARLMRWQDSRRKGDAGRVRSAFARLARDVGAGENRISAEGSVLVVGREGGATGASLHEQREREVAA